MRLAVLGCGAVGSVFARIAVLEKLGEVVCMDRSVERARAFLDYEEVRDLPVEQVDASKVDELSQRLKGFDFVVNALPTFLRVGRRELPLNPLVMEAALRAGVNYVDFACYGGGRRRAEQLLFSKKFRDAGLLALINVGASPGLSNLLAREVYEELDSTHTITIMSLEDQRGSSFVIPWSREEMFNVASEELAYRGGRFELREPFAETELCEFPEPIGVLRCYSVSNDESYTIPHFLRIRSLRYLAGGSDIEVLRALYRLGIFSDRPLRVGRALVTPREVIYHVLQNAVTPKDVERALREGDLEDALFALQVVGDGEVSGERALAKRHIVFPSQRKLHEVMPGSTYITYPTARCGVALLRAVKGRKLRGVLPPEALPRPLRKMALEDLEKAHMIVNEEFKVLF
uniref:Saccharopine dehydrogenase NADP binding domain-containing protein n=1 Tax=Thermofilum pendens TaxID=2269 RepID=A0A7C4BB62_THEPE